MPRLLLPILLFLASSVVAAQSPQSVKPQPAPQVDVNARFRSLNSSTPITLADYQGKVVVLALWATWCGPCRTAMYSLADLRTEFATRGVQVIALSIEDPQKAEAETRKFLVGFPVDYKTGWIGKISAERLMAKEAVVPKIFVIKDGVILRSLLGWNPATTVMTLRQALDTAQTKSSRELPLE
jgi:thiol-disulfide isomerase/thioredoxin